MAYGSRFNLPRVTSAGAALAVALVAVSVAGALFPGLREALLLVPSLVLRGAVWQLLSYALIEVSPTGVIFGALILWSIGGVLEARWGTRRLLLFAAGVAAASAAATVLLALALPGWVAPVYTGGNVLSGSVWVAYGLLVGRGETNFWGARVTGNGLALIGAAFVLLNAVFGGVAALLPDLFSLGFTWLAIRGASPGRLLGRLGAWRREQELRRRGAHLKSVDGGRRGPPRDRDQYLN